MNILWHCLSLGLEWKMTCGHSWVFQICWHIECGTFTASSFRIWRSSAGIQSPPLALSIVMLPKAHLTSHSRMSGPRSVITASWWSESWRSFLDSSSVHFPHLFLISSASLRSIPFLSFSVSIFAWNLPSVSLIFLTRSLVFPILLFSFIDNEGFLISPCYSLKLCTQMAECCQDGGGIGRQTSFSPTESSKDHLNAERLPQNSIWTLTEDTTHPERQLILFERSRIKYKRETKEWGTETCPLEGVMKEEKFPHSRKPSHRWICGEFWNLRRQHNQEETNLQNTCLTATAEKGTFPWKALT